MSVSGLLCSILRRSTEPRRGPLALPAALATAMLFTGLPARADPAAGAPRDESRRALALFTEGQREYNLGHFAAALPLFEQAYKVNPLPQLLFNIAQCHRQVGNLSQARRLYQNFLDQRPDSQYAQVARDKLREVEKALIVQAEARTSQPTSLAVPEKQGVQLVVVEKAAKKAVEGSSSTLADPAAVPGPTAATSTPPAAARPLALASAAPVPPRVEDVMPGPVTPASPGAASEKKVPQAAIQPLPGKLPPVDNPRSNHVVAMVAMAAGVAGAGVGTWLTLKANSAHDELAAGVGEPLDIETGPAHDELAAGKFDRATADRDLQAIQRGSLANVLVIAGAALVAGGIIAWLAGAP